MTLDPRFFVAVIRRILGLPVEQVATRTILPRVAAPAGPLERARGLPSREPR